MEAEQYVTGDYLVDGVIEDREYQTYLVEQAQHESTLIALPTGTGKTAVAVRLAAHRLAEEGGKAVFLAPTQPLVQQHTDFFKEALAVPDHEIVAFTGDIDPEDRKEQWNGATSVVISTPQVIENDLIGNRYDLSNVSYLGVDECHRATGDYAYVYIGEQYQIQASNGLATGFSASPGSSKEDILQVCENLGLSNIDVLTEEDEMLSAYTHDVERVNRWITMPDELLEARDLVQEVFKERLVKLKDMGVISSARKDLSVGKLMRARGDIQQLIDNDDSKGYKAMSLHAEALKLRHGWATIEQESADAAVEYFNRIEQEANDSNGSKAAARLIRSERIRQAREKLEAFDGHPKLGATLDEVVKIMEEDGQAIIFTESRDTAAELTEYLDVGVIDPARFVGQADRGDDEGMSQAEQRETIEAFRNGEYDVLISTSVAEEGIDIPAVDLVLFYEPIPDAIRNIQRRGRTGRESDGRVVVLIAKDTTDEDLYFASQQREQNMQDELAELKDIEDDIMSELEDQQTTLGSFDEADDSEDDGDQYTVYVDSRETKSSVVKQLDGFESVRIELETLEVADYVVSDQVAIERKEKNDFINSLTDSDRNLFDQIDALNTNYDQPVLIVEGVDSVEDLYGLAQVSEEAIRSAVQSIGIEFGATLLYTGDETETAKQVRSLARREQEDRDRTVNPHGSKPTSSPTEMQEYVVGSFPHVGPVIAQDLLAEFGSIKAIMNADREDLTAVENIGDQTADDIMTLVEREYSATE